MRLCVDSLCINQEHISEKDHQVALIYEIYGSDSTVLVSSGELRGDCFVASCERPPKVIKVLRQQYLRVTPLERYRNMKGRASALLEPSQN